MKFRHALRSLGTAGLAGLIACPPTQALVSLNDSRDHIYVTGTLGVARNSNIAANRLSGADTVLTAELLTEFTRRAGWIAVNGAAALEVTRYEKTTADNAINPRFNLEFMKQTGRTTGALALSARRESRADAAVNVRSQSWNYAAGLTYRYPVIERYSFSGSFGFARTDYANNTASVTSPAFVDLDVYSTSLDLLYALSSERDLLVGYRYRNGNTSAFTTYDDHAFIGGVTGKIIPGLTGSLRGGYQVRLPYGYGDEAYHSWTATAATTWSVNKKAKLTGAISKDFSSTAIDTSVDTLNTSLNLQYAHSFHWTAYLGGEAGRTYFLGLRGRTNSLNRQRVDTYTAWNTGINYSLNEHFKASLGYSWLKNFSTLLYSDFTRHTWTLSVSSRW